MRFVIFLSIIVLAVSGCSTGTCMYSVPSQSSTCMQSASMQTTAQPRAYKQTSPKHRRATASAVPAKRSKPAQKKSGKNKSFLNNAMGVSVKLAKDTYRYFKPKLSKLPGF